MTYRVGIDAGRAGVDRVFMLLRQDEHLIVQAAHE